MTRSICVSLLAVLLLVCQSQSNPVSSLGLVPRSTPQEATFDDLAVPVGSYEPLPVPYKMLQFRAFNVVSQALVDGLPPHSPPNVAGTGMVTDVTSGQTPAITTLFPGSAVASIDLISLFFGCIINDQAGVLLPVGCAVRFTGTKAGTSKQVTQLLTFTPQTVLGTGQPATTAEMQQGIFSADFLGVVEVGVAIISTSTPGNLPSDAVVFEMDDLIFNTYPIAT